jgi:hypothetical protein
MSANEWACEHYYPLSICYLTISGQIIFLLCFKILMLCCEESDGKLEMATEK